MLRLAPAALAAALAACSAVGPDYQRSKDAAIAQPAANAALLGASEAEYSTAALPDDWWKLYEDPALDALIAQTLAANTDLRVAAANLARARSGVALASADRLPSTKLEAGPAYERLSAEEQLIPGGKALPDEWVYGVGIGISYQLDLFGQVLRAIESAQANVAAAQAAADAVRVTVVADTTRAYLEACSAGRERAVVQRLVALQQRSTELTQRLVKAGRGSRIDLTRSTGQQDQVRAALPALEARKRLALYRLAALAGQPPANFPAAAEQCVEEPKIRAPIPVGDGAALLARRPDLRRAEAELHAATARIGFAESALYPKIILGASIGSVGLAENFNHNDTYKYSIGPLLSWEFPERRRAEAHIAGAKADTGAALAHFDGAVLNALRETESALTVYARDLDRRALLDAARSKAERTAADSEALYAAGRQAYLPVLDAQRTLLQLEQSVADADSRLAADQVTLFLALGGGWQRQPDAKAE